MKPEECKFAETHEWAKIEGKDICLIGISDHAVGQLSDLVHVELPKPGEPVEQGSAFGEIESVKTVAELVSPVTGKVKEINEDVLESPDLISQDPYGDGWLLKVTMEDPSELESLLSAKEYEAIAESDEEEDEDDDDDDFM